MVEAKCTLIIEGTDTRIEGAFFAEDVMKATSYYKTGYQFTARFKNKQWDGRTRLFNRAIQTFPMGLTFDVKAVLEEKGIKVQIIDKRPQPSIPALSEGWSKDIELEGINFDYPFDFQPKVAEKMVSAKSGVIAIATNGGKTEASCIVIKALRIPTLFIVPGKELLYQTAERFRKRLGLKKKDNSLGLIGDGHWNPGKWITIALPATLSNRIKTDECKRFLTTINLLLIDECHRASSDTIYKIARICPAYYRFGLSGTPLKRTDGADLRLIGLTGPIICDIRNKELIERGISNKVKILFLRVTEPQGLHPKTPYEDVYRVCITENEHRNDLLCQKIMEFVKEDMSVLLLVKEIEHGNTFDKKLVGCSHQFINGEETQKVRQKALKEFGRGDLNVLIATKILNEGIDVPAIDVVVRADSGKSSIETLQKIGRGIRKGGKTDTLLVLETADFTHRHLLRHSLQRLDDYRNEGCFEIEVEDVS